MGICQHSINEFTSIIIKYLCSKNKLYIIIRLALQHEMGVSPPNLVHILASKCFFRCRHQKPPPLFYVNPWNPRGLTQTTIIIKYVQKNLHPLFLVNPWKPRGLTQTTKKLKHKKQALMWMVVSRELNY